MFKQCSQRMPIAKYILTIVFFNTFFPIVIAKENIPIEIRQQLLQGQFEKAASQLKVLVTQENTEAQYQLAILFLNGKGVKKSVTRAELLLKKSTKQSSQAAFLLGSLYYKGKQLAKNEEKAKYYLNIAASGGNKRAESLLLAIKTKKVNSNRIKPQTQRLFELAIASGNLSLAIKQHLNGANLNYPNEKGNPPLITAITLDRKDIANWLIKQKVDVKQIDLFGNTALHIAAKHGQIQAVIAIAKQLDNIDLANNNRQTPLIIAVKSKQQTTAQWLINQGASRVTKDNSGKSADHYNQIAKLDLNSPGRRNRSNNQNNQIALKQAAHQIKSLQTQSKTQSSPYLGWPVLAIAVAQGQIDIADQLLTKGHSPWKETQKFDTAISLSLANEYYELLSRMLKMHPIEQQNSPRGIKTFFYRAIEKDKTELIQPLLNRARQLGITDLIHKGLNKAIDEQNVNSTDLFLSMLKELPSEELLRFSIVNNKFKVTKLLIEKGIPLNSQDETGRTPLIIAAQKGNNQVITLLLERKVPLEIRDSQGLSALMWATKENCLSCVELLMLNGASPEKTSKTGNNSVMFAAQKSIEILKILLKSEPELSTRNQQSFTALMLAINGHNIENVKILLEHGANPRRKTASGLDSFDLAANKPEILSLLNQSD